MILKLVPDYYFTTIEDIPYDKLYADGVRLILTDLDNTLISYKEEEPTEALFKWKEKILGMGFEVIIVSNSRKYRVEHFANILGLPFVKFAKKPLKSGMKKALKLASRKYSLNEIVEIGDQVMTDVFASRRMNIITILVKAIDRKTEVFTTRINRKLEKFFLNRIQKKYPLIYKEKLLQYVEEKDDYKEM